VRPSRSPLQRIQADQKPLTGHKCDHQEVSSSNSSRSETWRRSGCPPGSAGRLLYLLSGLLGVLRFIPLDALCEDDFTEILEHLGAPPPRRLPNVPKSTFSTICVMSGAVKLEPENDHEKKVATDGKG